MWTAVSGRLHTPVKIYPFGSGSSEVMLFGTVDYSFKDGKKVTVCISNLSGAMANLTQIEWGGRANVVKEDNSWKLGFYQVYMVSRIVTIFHDS